MDLKQNALTRFARESPSRKSSEVTRHVPSRLRGAECGWAREPLLCFYDPPERLHQMQDDIISHPESGMRNKSVMRPKGITREGNKQRND